MEEGGRSLNGRLRVQRRSDESSEFMSATTFFYLFLSLNAKGKMSK